jgi:hypothetical protein
MWIHRARSTTPTWSVGRHFGINLRSWTSSPFYKTSLPRSPRLLPANKGHLPSDQHTPHRPYLRCHQTSPRDLQVEYNPRHRKRRDHLHPHQSRGSRPRHRSHLNRNLHQPRFNRAAPRSPHPRQRSAASQVTMRPTGNRYCIRNLPEPGLRVMRQPLRCRRKHHNLRRRRGDRYPLQRRILRSRILLLLITLRSIKGPRPPAFPRARNNPSRPRAPGARRISPTHSNTAPLPRQPGNNRRRPSSPNQNRNHPLLPT